MTVARSVVGMAVIACFPLIHLAFASVRDVGPESVPGDVYVANIRGNTVTAYDGSTGRFRGTFVEAGSGGLSGPTGLAFGPDGHLYVSSSLTNTILRFDGETGAFMGTFVSDSTLETPFSLIFGPDGHLYVSSGTRHIVLRFDGVTGGYQGVAASGDGLQQPIGLRFGPDGSLFVVNSGGRNVMRFNPATGESLGTFASDSLRFPADLVFGPDGTLYVTSAATGTVVRYNMDGSIARIAGRLPEGAAPVGIDVGVNGDLFVADFAGDRLFVLNVASQTVTLASDSGLAGPENIVVKR